MLFKTLHLFIYSIFVNSHYCHFMCLKMAFPLKGHTTIKILIVSDFISFCFIIVSMLARIRCLIFSLTYFTTCGVLLMVAHYLYPLNWTTLQYFDMQRTVLASQYQSSQLKTTEYLLRTNGGPSIEYRIYLFLLYIVLQKSIRSVYMFYS